MENNNIKSGSVFYSYCLNPKITFETHEEGEKINLLLRRHPFTQISWVLNSIFLLIFLFVLNIFLQNFLNFTQVLVFNIFAVVFVLSYIWFNVLNWYFNVGIVTNRRVVDINFDSILYRQITVAQLDKIQDITIKSGGYFDTLFDFGSIYVQTAGTEENVIFEDVPHPSDAVKIINQLLSRRHGS